MLKDFLLISGIYPPEIGGPAVFAERFSQWTLGSGGCVKVVTYSDKSHFEIISQGLKLHRVARKKIIAWRYLIFIRQIACSVDKKTQVLAVGAFIETYLSALILGFNYVAKVPGDIVWERARNSGKTILTIDEFQNAKLDFKYKLFRFVYSKSLRRAKFVIVPSEGLYRLCLLWGVKREKLHLIYNSVSIPEVSNFNLETKKNHILTVCRLTAWKGVDELIEYVSKKNLSLVVAGDGPERSHLESLASKINANVLFLGDSPHDSVSALFHDSRVFVLNSYYEGLPHALIEARAHNILTVARAGTGSQEVIHDDIDGLLVRQDRNLENTLDLVFSGDIDADTFVRRAYEDTENRFNQESNFELINRILEKTIK